MRTLLRAAIAGSFGLCLAAMLATAADPPLTPEWHQDLSYLTWDRAADAPAGADGRQVYLRPSDQALDQELGTAWSVEVAPVWHERVKNLYGSILDRGKSALGFGRPQQTTPEPVGIAQRSEGARVR